MALELFIFSLFKYLDLITLKEFCLGFETKGLFRQRVHSLKEELNILFLSLFLMDGLRWLLVLI